MPGVSPSMLSALLLLHLCRCALEQGFHKRLWGHFGILTYINQSEIFNDLLNGSSVRPIKCAYHITDTRTPVITIYIKTHAVYTSGTARICRKEYLSMTSKCHSAAEQRGFNYQLYLQYNSSHRKSSKEQHKALYREILSLYNHFVELIM